MAQTQEEFIRELMDFYGVEKQSALENYIGVDQSTISRIVLGHQIGRKSAIKIAEATGRKRKNIFEVLGIPYRTQDQEIDDKPPEGKSFQLLDPLLAILSQFGTVARQPRRPHYGSVPAGVPEDREAVFREAREGHYDYRLTVKGDSMELDLYDGDEVIVRTDREARPGDIVVATVDGENVLKRLEAIHTNGETTYSLVPSNCKYQSIKEGDITIQGVVERADVSVRELTMMRRRLAELEAQLKQTGTGEE